MNIKTTDQIIIAWLLSIEKHWLCCYYYCDYYVHEITLRLRYCYCIYYDQITSRLHYYYWLRWQVRSSTTVILLLITLLQSYYYHINMILISRIHNNIAVMFIMTIIYFRYLCFIKNLSMMFLQIRPKLRQTAPSWHVMPMTHFYLGKWVRNCLSRHILTLI